MTKITNAEIQRSVETIKYIRAYCDSKVVGQQGLKDSLLIALLTNGHILLESVPGLAKTTAAKVLTEAISETTLKKLLIRNDVLVMNISSATLDGKKAYDACNDRYLPDFFAKDKKLIQLFKTQKENLEKQSYEKLKKLGIAITTIDDTDDIDDSVIELLHR